MSFIVTNVLNPINWIIVPYLDKFAMVFVDDIFVYSKTENDQARHKRIVWRN